MNGGPPGDLYVALNVRPHPHFIRKGQEILYDLRLNFVTATLGGRIEVPTLKGPTMVKIPEGTQHDQILRLKGLSAPGLKISNPRGPIDSRENRYPDQTHPKQRELLNAFAQESGINIDSQGEGLFDKVKNLFD
ncbi:MAG: DnaJ C-terminal domain-containing protein [Nitrospirales bacterium]|nr:hypothetical protein [Nitrospirales bacterium]